nr:immunoglobulin heavy chain junction region [Macaca mulatta]MPN83286.1 immunoglobulin heavy chain junction region [Macaca mulatta]MPN83290.1 immunoglobulin heavy chain junction region [Macaca mulatta]MPN83294.1 immunoglobulin heavy chain junction region [Macaca mulatta]MPN83339.1 immunoglobulin heavy chain junction region [Macaca mulatta]
CARDLRLWIGYYTPSEFW